MKEQKHQLYIYIPQGIQSCYLPAGGRLNTPTGHHGAHYRRRRDGLIQRAPSPRMGLEVALIATKEWSIEGIHGNPSRALAQHCPRVPERRTQTLEPRLASPSPPPTTRFLYSLERASQQDRHSPPRRPGMSRRKRLWLGLSIGLTSLLEKT